MAASYAAQRLGFLLIPCHHEGLGLLGLVGRSGMLMPASPQSR